MTEYKIPGALWMAGFCIAFAALTVAGFVAWDQPALEAVRAGAGAGFKGLARALSRYGDFPWLLGGGLIALAICLVTKRRPWARIVTAMVLAGVIADGQREGVVRADAHPRILARALFGALDGVALTWALGGAEPGTLTKAAVQITSVFLDGIRVRSPQSHALPSLSPEET